MPRAIVERAENKKKNLTADQINITQLFGAIKKEYKYKKIEEFLSKKQVIGNINHFKSIDKMVRVVRMDKIVLFGFNIIL